jgi:hypothetical protein
MIWMSGLARCLDIWTCSLLYVFELQNSVTVPRGFTSSWIYSTRLRLQLQLTILVFFCFWNTNHNSENNYALLSLSLSLNHAHSVHGHRTRHCVYWCAATTSLSHTSSFTSLWSSVLCNFVSLIRFLRWEIHPRTVLESQAVNWNISSSVIMCI